MDGDEPAWSDNSSRAYERVRRTDGFALVRSLLCLQAVQGTRLRDPTLAHVPPIAAARVGATVGVVQRIARPSDSVPVATTAAAGGSGPNPSAAATTSAVVRALGRSVAHGSGAAVSPPRGTTLGPTAALRIAAVAPAVTGSPTALTKESFVETLGSALKASCRLQCAKPSHRGLDIALHCNWAHMGLRGYASSGCE